MRVILGTETRPHVLHVECHILEVIMKNKKIRKLLIGILVSIVFVIGISVFDNIINHASYAYIKDVYTKNDNIVISVDGGNGDSKYHHYEFNEIGNGIYEFQLYVSAVSGKVFPVEIELNNKSDKIKEIRQKPNNGDESGKEYEIIYPIKNTILIKR